MSDGASAGVLGDSLELPSVLAFLSRFTAAGHHQRCFTFPICMSYHDIRKLSHHCESLASTCSLDLLLHSKAEPNSLGLF